MLSARILTLLTAVLLSSPAVAIATEDYSQGAVPDWVVPFELPAASDDALEPSKYGLAYQLVDDQIRVNGEQREYYVRRRVKIVHQVGVPHVAQMSFEYDPSYQHITMHHMVIERDGERIDKFSAARIDVIQREKELESMIYNGRKSINVILEDVRVGDILDYSYTNTGANPIFRGRLFNNFDLQWMVPVRDVRYRITMPADRPLQSRPIGTFLAPEVTEEEGVRIHEWTLHDIKQFIPEDETPSWYLMHPLLHVSEMSLWSDVQTWGRDLYAIPDPLPEPVIDQAQLIRTVHGEQAAQLLAAIRFVQDEVRYTGIEIGPHSYEPNPPQKVMGRRFGDCKDKSLLLISLLRALDIEAHLALVNTALYTTVPDFLPDPTVFNHAIVQIRFDGNEYWVDPTLPLRRGDLDHMWPVDYGYALVINGESDDLVRMPEDNLSDPDLIIREVLDLSGGVEEPARLDIYNELRGASADSMRYQLSVYGPEAVQKSFMDVIGRIYPDVEAAGELEVSDDEVTNVIELNEHYQIGRAWQHDADKAMHTVALYFAEMSEYLELPGNTKRSMPLVVHHPRHIKHTFDVALPGDDWNIESIEESVSDEAFELITKGEFKDGHLYLDYTFKTLTREVPVERAEQYQRNLSKAAESLSYQVYMGDGEDLSYFMPKIPLLHWGTLVVVLGVIAFVIWGTGLARLMSVYFRRPLVLLRKVTSGEELPPLFLFLVWADGCVLLVDKIASDYSPQQEYLQQWPTIWIIAALFGMPLGFFRYYIGGGMIHIAQLAAGGRGDYRTSRRLYVYSSFPMDIATMVLAVTVGILYGNEHLARDHMTLIEILGNLVVLVGLGVFSLIVLYKGVRHILKASKWGARLIFLALPLLAIVSIIAIGIWHGE